jgi:hypothetical protein
MRQALNEAIVKLYGRGCLARASVEIVMQKHEILKYTGRRTGEIEQTTRENLRRIAHGVRRFNQRRRWTIRLMPRSLNLRGYDAQQGD